MFLNQISNLSAGGEGGEIDGLRHLEEYLTTYLYAPSFRPISIF